MITASPLARQQNRWQRELAAAITDPRELCRLLDLDPSLALQGAAAEAQFPLRVPRGFVRRMRRGDLSDPLLLQVLPRTQESVEHPGFEGDPLQEYAAARTPGLLHKYQGRALLVTTGACAVHCRYCFRREFPYQEQQVGGRWREALAVIAADPSIEEIILSGGDPLSLSDARLAALTSALARIPHLQRLRLHTRTPIVLPERVDAGLTDWLGSLPWPVAIVLHANHANEIDSEVQTALRQLRDSGAVLLNQSVLLAGVNDSIEALQALSEALWRAGVLPYYLHLLDRVRGAAHFEVSEPRARQLGAALAARLPGYLVPRLVREVAGAPAKVALLPTV
ncbi:MAG: EF-P beta-lysylation protein EpmB [Steroidobacterales bacterium]